MSEGAQLSTVNTITCDQKLKSNKSVKIVPERTHCTRSSLRKLIIILLEFQRLLALNGEAPTILDVAEY
jgi:hypothetical protein